MGKLDASEAQGPTCGVCSHYVEVSEAHGTCFFNPPVPYPVPTQGQLQMPGKQTAAAVAVMPLRPPVAFLEFACGHFDRLETDDSDPPEKDDSNHPGDLPPGRPSTLWPKKS